MNHPEFDDMLDAAILLRAQIIEYVNDNKVTTGFIHAIDEVIGAIQDMRPND